MYYGLYTPNFGAECSGRALADLAREAEESGWDGFFLWDHILYSPSQRLPVVDPWVALAAMAMNTERIRLGTAVTPLARRRPWVLARQTASLDHLSGGRLILSVGLGAPLNTEYAHFGEEAVPKTLAGKLDEGLEILEGLWSGKPFRYRGKHYRLKATVFLPPALQQPRIPVWVGGFWPNRAPFLRAARWDGVIPLKTGGIKPDDISAILVFIKEQRTGTRPFDFAMIGHTTAQNPKKARRTVAACAEAGATWWLESLFVQRNSLESLRQRIHQGPPD